MRKTIVLLTGMLPAVSVGAQLECYNLENPNSVPVYVSFDFVPDMQSMQRGYLWPDGWSGRQANPGDYDKYTDGGNRGGDKQ